ncbi:MAG: hypothetical protein JHC26_05275 [Thermofilum sp.]|jgi:hypothetical protein|uniref:hypothetical protein n=1 Tax=Thermofilum sp. TaxID=1961369 RepID=UPI002585FE0D|nr:hypothetical protein [Thermofilum sp.]MCI4408482.1 hypothetical protein [Thermofilum sp.]
MMRAKMVTVEDWQLDLALYVYFRYFTKLAKFYSKTGSVLTHGIEDLPFTAPTPLILRTITTYLNKYQIPHNIQKMTGRNVHRIIIYDIPLFKKTLENRNLEQILEELASCAEEAYSQFKKEMAIKGAKVGKKKHQF